MATIVTPGCKCCGSGSSGSGSGRLTCPSILTLHGTYHCTNCTCIDGQTLVFNATGQPGLPTWKANSNPCFCDAADLVECGILGDGTWRLVSCSGFAIVDGVVLSQNPLEVFFPAFNYQICGGTCTLTITE